MMNIVKSNSVVFVLALGATYVVISGGVDLSVASATAASAMVFGLILTTGASAPVAIVAALLFGASWARSTGLPSPTSRYPSSWSRLAPCRCSRASRSSSTKVRASASFHAGFQTAQCLRQRQYRPFPVIMVFDLALLLIAGDPCGSPLSVGRSTRSAPTRKRRGSTGSM